VAVQEDFIASGGTTLLKLDDHIQHSPYGVKLTEDDSKCPVVMISYAS
jgi:hypothetical protein